MLKTNNKFKFFLFIFSLYLTIVFKQKGSTEFLISSKGLNNDILGHVASYLNYKDPAFNYLLRFSNIKKEDYEKIARIIIKNKLPILNTDINNIINQYFSTMIINNKLKLKSYIHNAHSILLLANIFLKRFNHTDTDKLNLKNWISNTNKFSRYLREIDYQLDQYCYKENSKKDITEISNIEESVRIATNIYSNNLNNMIRKCNSLKMITKQKAIKFIITTIIINPFLFMIYLYTIHIKNFAMPDGMDINNIPIIQIIIILSVILYLTAQRIIKTFNDEKYYNNYKYDIYDINNRIYKLNNSLSNIGLDLS